MGEGGEIPTDRGGGEGELPTNSGGEALAAVSSNPQDPGGNGPHDTLSGDNALAADDDPLRVKELALRFDYLLYRLKDHIATVLQEAVERVENKDNLTRFNDLLNMDEQIAYLQRLLVSLREIDSDIATIHQVSEIVAGFRLRLREVEHGLKR